MLSHARAFSVSAIVLHVGKFQNLIAPSSLKHACKPAASCGPNRLRRRRRVTSVGNVSDALDKLLNPHVEGGWMPVCKTCDTAITNAVVQLSRSHAEVGRVGCPAQRRRSECICLAHARQGHPGLPIGLGSGRARAHPEAIQGRPQACQGARGSLRPSNGSMITSAKWRHGAWLRGRAPVPLHGGRPRLQSISRR